MSRDKLDTGTGGFSVTVNNSANRYTFDTGTTVGDEAPVPWSPGEINVEQENKDISKGTKRTLAAYLSKTTMGQTPSSPTAVANKYQISQNEKEDPNTLSLRDERGYPQPLAAAPQGQDHFIDVQPGDGRSPAASNLNMLRGRQPVEIAELAPRDGNSLLKDLELKPEENKPYKKLADTDPVGVYSRSLLNNRFTSDNSYPTKPETSQIWDAQYAYKYPMGKSLPKEAPERNISYGRLAQIGNALSIRAGLELKSLDPGKNPTDNASQAGAILPGHTQLGVHRLEREQLEAASVLESLTTENIDDNLLIDPAKQSWGTLNNVLDQYGGISNFGMQLLAVALIVALSLVVTLITTIIPGTDSPTSKKSGMDDKGIRPLGRSYAGKSKRLDYSSIASIVSQGSDFNFWGLLGFPPTDHDLSKCLGAGVLLFFGIVPPNGSAISLGNLAPLAAVEGAKSGMKNPGYYTVMARSINRSFLLISDSLLSLGKSFASGNFVTGAQQSLEFLNVFRESKFMGSLRVFSRLGDAYLIDADNPKIKGDRHVTLFDSLSDDNVFKGRIFESTMLSWSSYRTRDLLIYPYGLRHLTLKDKNSASSIVSDKIEYFTEYGRSIKAKYATNSSNRIDPDIREKMEASLNSEYVPFYFHDVRTNEILSFHAFLASLSDDYSATYDSSEGFGRVEPVKTYKGTQRKIGFSFYVAATSEEDFSVMWDKINKLVTLVYPQYTEGRLLSSSDKKYNIHMPFSQTIQASPMVRVRIGDLIRSNYSKFNLARLFGYSYQNTKFDGVEIPEKDSKGEVSSDMAKKYAYSAQWSTGNTFKPTDKEQILGAGNARENVLLSRVATTALPGFFGLKLVAVATAKDEPDIYEVICLGDEESDGVGGAATYADETNPAFTSGIKLKLSRTQVVPTKSTQAKHDNELSRVTSNLASHKYEDKVKEFMDEENNAVAKSFKSTGGKGLAGFIESMSFDWYDRITWETHGTTGKAPKMCKVTISFSPIHDISPGLDHEGGNRAPVYPVGGFFRK